MKKRLGFLFLIGIMIAAEASCGEDPKPGLIGSYESVTESECNIELSLLDQNKALIRQICRFEKKGPPEDVTEVTEAGWSFGENRLRVQYEDVEDSLEFVQKLFYQDFGEKGSGPGLRLVGPVNPKSRLAGYGNLWKRPLPGE